MPLTKTPLSMLDAGDTALANDDIVFNGAEVESQAPGSNSTADKFVTNGVFDSSIGRLSIVMADNSIINIDGFVTEGNIGTGPRGPDGVMGAQGKPGRNGTDGRQGLPGCTGPKGDMGPLGGNGPAGPTGPRGSVGAVGPTGPSGGNGAAGVDGERPVYTPGTVASSETVQTGRIVQWGKFTDVTIGQVKTLIFPEAFAATSRPRALLLQWIDPASNVANKVRVESLDLGSATLTVSLSLLEQIPDGAGGFTAAPMSGWNFYWFVIGE